MFSVFNYLNPYKKAVLTMQKYWWANHKQTFRHEIKGGFLWSPKLKSDGTRNYFYDTMADAELGDTVLSYANGQVSYFGIVVEEASSAKNQNNFPLLEMVGTIMAGFYQLPGTR